MTALEETSNQEEQLLAIDLLGIKEPNIKVSLTNEITIHPVDSNQCSINTKTIDGNVVGIKDKDVIISTTENGLIKINLELLKWLIHNGENISLYTIEKTPEIESILNLRKNKTLWQLCYNMPNLEDCSSLSGKNFLADADAFGEAQDGFFKREFYYYFDKFINTTPNGEIVINTEILGIVITRAVAIDLKLGEPYRQWKLLMYIFVLLQNLLKSIAGRPNLLKSIHGREISCQRLEEVNGQRVIRNGVVITPDVGDTSSILNGAGFIDDLDLSKPGIYGNFLVPNFYNSLITGEAELKPALKLESSEA